MITILITLASATVTALVGYDIADKITPRITEQAKRHMALSFAIAGAFIALAVITTIKP